MERMHRVMCWVECNYPEDLHPKGKNEEDRLTHTMRIAQKMDSLGMIPIVTTQPGYEQLVYTSLARVVPNVVGGSKSSHWRETGDIIGAITTPAFWKRVAAHTDTIYTHAGGPVVMDNESLFGAILNTPNCMNQASLDAMTEAVARAKWKRLVWMAGVNVLEDERCTAWSVKVVDALSKGMGQRAQWMTPFWAWGPEWKDQPRTKIATALMSTVRPADWWVPMMFAQPNGVWPARDDSSATPVWAPAQFNAAHSDPAYAYSVINGKRKQPMVLYAGDETEEFLDMLTKIRTPNR